jgi:hypothetical protein
MRTFQSFVHQISIKWLAKRILRRWGDEEMRKWGDEKFVWSFWRRIWRMIILFLYFLLWRFWKIIVKVLEGNEREVVGVRFVDLYLVGSTKAIHCAMYLERQSIYLRTRYDGWEGGMIKSFRGLKSDQQLSSKSMFVFCLYLGFVVLLFKSEYPNFGNSKGL